MQERVHCIHHLIGFFDFMFSELKTFNQQAAAYEAKTQALEESIQTIEAKTNTILCEYFLSFATGKFSGLSLALLLSGEKPIPVFASVEKGSLQNLQHCRGCL